MIPEIPDLLPEKGDFIAKTPLSAVLVHDTVTPAEHVVVQRLIDIGNLRGLRHRSGCVHDILGIVPFGEGEPFDKVPPEKLAPDRVPDKDFILLREPVTDGFIAVKTHRRLPAARRLTGKFPGRCFSVLVHDAVARAAHPGAEILTRTEHFLIHGRFCKVVPVEISDVIPRSCRKARVSRGGKAAVFPMDHVNPRVLLRITVCDLRAGIR